MTPPTFHVAINLVAEVRVNADGTATLGPLAGADLAFLLPGALVPFRRAEVTLPELPAHPLWQPPLQEAVSSAAKALAELCAPIVMKSG
jgi:hypothetical protein